MQMLTRLYVGGVKDPHKIPEPVEMLVRELGGATLHVGVGLWMDAAGEFTKDDTLVIEVLHEQTPETDLALLRAVKALKVLWGQESILVLDIPITNSNWF